MGKLEADRWGYHAYDPREGPDSKPVNMVRATSIAKVGDDPGGLTDWKAAQAMRGVAKSADLRARVLAAPADERLGSEVIEEACTIGGANEGRNLGSALHETVDQLNTGRTPETMDVPEIAGPAHAYLRAMEAAGLTVHASEFAVCNTGLARLVAGTVDNLTSTRSGRLVLADLKSTKPSSVRYQYLGWAAQLAIYAYADWQWNPLTDLWDPLEGIDREVAYVAHCPIDWSERGHPFCDLIPVDLVEGWEAAQLMAHMYVKRAENKRKDPPAVMLDKIRRDPGPLAVVS